LAGGTERIHATCVAFGDHGVVLRGPSGAGKSDLALRLIHLRSAVLPPARLVADDQVIIERRDGGLFASAPATLYGRLEVRGIGIISVPSVPSAAVALVIDLLPAAQTIERMPEADEKTLITGLAVPLRRFHAFEASTPLKIALALANLSHYAGPAGRPR
jgi:HPr kinase/phosphorylase